MSKVSLLLIPVLAFAGYSLAGCGNGQDRSAKTASSSAQVPVDVTKAKQDLDQVMSGLRNMRDASDSADLKKLYAALADPTVQLNDSLAVVISNSNAAVAAGKVQNDEWHKQADTFTDPELRNVSTKRQSDLRTAVDKLALSTTALKTESDAYIAQVNQTLKALDLDLSQQGIRVIKPTVGKLVEDESQLRLALSEISAASKAVTAIVNP